MRATFEELGPNSVRLELVPEGRYEAMLLAMWLRFDQNAIAADVQRDEDRRIEKVYLHTSTAQ